MRSSPTEACFPRGRPCWWRRIGGRPSPEANPIGFACVPSRRHETGRRVAIFSNDLAAVAFANRRPENGLVCSWVMFEGAGSICPGFLFVSVALSSLSALTTMSFQSPTRFVIVGLGRHAMAHYIPCLLACHDACVVGVCELGSEHARVRRCLPTIPVFEQADRMLNEVQADAAIVSTPHYLHAQQVALCLRHGLDVFVDKPLALRAQQAVALVNESHQAKRLLFTALPGRHSGVNSIFVDTIQAETLGRIVRLDFAYHRSAYPDFEHSWRNRSEHSGGGVLVDAGHHLADMLLRFARSPVASIRCQVEYERLRVEVAASVSVRLQDGACGHLRLSLNAPAGSLVHRIELAGTQGGLSYTRIRAPGSPDLKTLVEFGHQGSRLLPIPVEKNIDVEPLLEFMRLRAKGVRRVSDLDTDVQVIRFIETAYQSSASHSERGGYHEQLRRHSSDSATALLLAHSADH